MIQHKIIAFRSRNMDDTMSDKAGGCKMLSEHVERGWGIAAVWAVAEPGSTIIEHHFLLQREKQVAPAAQVAKGKR